MHLYWKYENGNWFPIEDPAPSISDVEPWGECLQRAGYGPRPFLDLGTEGYGNSVTVYKRQDEGPPLYILVTLPNDEGMTVLVDDMANLMQWLKDYWTPLVLDNMHFEQTEMMKIIEKAFQAWHGHDVDDICAECDPHGWEKLLRYRAERSRQRQTGRDNKEEDNARRS